ncbi:hypothetical protein CB0940_06556 [Cercospora beticola]|uniref:BHLH domain-containing protein n=1 Tax=Cercospora beticola TaxID=122368 RepID=A0A2G5HZ83_CERBT|nr:hypothetical protein CB0940_06556 [Cercospora beticola]PIA97848.1 hypothetical protein CB0940_06556 [Cercospora beticola]WPA99198.1 hypothetical protein RHO25_003814 [Cercospora beticola]CAK1360509.1 unnamed protein product [Cercospora beticola]
MSSGRGGVESSQRGQNVEQNLWTGFPGSGGAVPGAALSYTDPTPLQRSLVPEQPQSYGKPTNQAPDRLPGMMDARFCSANVWPPGTLNTAAVKNGDGSVWSQHVEGTVRTDAGNDPEVDQAPSSNKSSPSIPSRPHAAVEKRYRRTVNTKLQQLHAAIPPSGSFSLDPAERFRSSMDGSEPEQAAKPVVLDKAIQYTTHLIETYRKYDNDIETLRQQVRDWLGEEEGTSSPGSNKGSAG